MTDRPSSAYANAATGPGVPEPSAELGRAFAARVNECTRMAEVAGASAGLQEPSGPIAAKLRRTRNLGSRFIARWLVTGKRQSKAEVDFVSELGQMAASEGLSIADMSRLYLIWRDSNLFVMGEEAARLQTPPEIAEMALVAIRVSTDRSIVRMGRAFDAEMWHLRAEMEHSASHDTLTGLPNRALFMDRLSQALKRTSREVGAQSAVLFVDLDRFKAVNDSLGHAAGDKLLTMVGRRLTKSIRDTDTAGRLGGDEFAVIIEGIQGAEDAIAVTERMLARLNRPVKIGSKRIPVTASVGMALTDGTQDAAELLHNADLAMYSAKTTGAGNCVIFEPRMHAEALTHLNVEADLRRGIDSNQFEVYYQPIINLETGTVLGVEALVRWNHPERGLLSPIDFIPIAEETGLIVPLGLWVMGKALQQVQEWRQRPSGGSLSVSVNLSARQLQHEDLVDEVQEALAVSHLDPGALTIEITETVLMKDTDATRDRLQRLKSLGVSLAIDDFGVGYSSLGYLQQFPIDALKIDRSFIQYLGNSTEESAVAAAVLTLAAALHLDAVAEGIEDSDQLRVLRNLGCRVGQGFLFSKPLPSTEIQSLLFNGPAGTLVTLGQRPRRDLSSIAKRRPPPR